MTCIAHFPTKKAFREAVLETKGRVTLIDPSIFNPFHGLLIHYMVDHDSCAVTNHPKRSWFARVTKKPDGSFKVE